MGFITMKGQGVTLDDLFYYTKETCPQEHMTKYHILNTHYLCLPPSIKEIPGNQRTVPQC